MCSVEVHGQLQCLYEPVIGVGWDSGNRKGKSAFHPCCSPVNIIEPLLSNKVSSWKLKVLEMNKKIAIMEARDTRKERRKTVVGADVTRE